MPTELATMNWRDYEERFSVELEVANHEDVVQAKKGFLPRNKYAELGFQALWTPAQLG